MWGRFTNSRPFWAAVLGISFGVAGCSHAASKTAVKSPPKDQTASAEPDKVLYDRAADDMKHGHYLEGRLSVETLINTYPDSEYLAKAKLLWGDSYFKEGGSSNLTLAINEYQEFQTFFGTVLPDEAAYAQMQIGMAHYRMMEKSDRDNTETQAAEEAFQTFLLKYPQDRLAPQAEERLREVQEVLADGEFKIGQFYFVKQDYAAATARLLEISDRYPLYSHSDSTLWMLGDVYMRAKQVSKNEDDKNHWADLAGECYARIARDYPLSRLAPQAKARLRAMGMAVPAADQQAFARMQKQQMYEKNHHPSLVKLPLALFKTGPNVATAARTGDPNLNPPSDAISATQVLLPGAAGPTFGEAAKPADSAAGDNSAGAAADSTTSGIGADTPAIGGAGVQIIAAPTTADPVTPAAPNSGTSTVAPATPATTPATAPTTAPPIVPATTGAAGSSTPATNVSAASGSTSDPASTTGDKGPQTAAGQAQGSSTTQPKPASGGAESARADKKTESTSKKKKGVKKLIPW